MDFAVKSGIFFTVMYLAGLLVLKKGVRVNYTRKVSHFSLLFVPFLLGMISRPGGSSGGGTGDYLMQIAGLLSGLLFLAMFIRPIRERVGAIRTAFLSINRPEDMPYTLRWLATQTAANFLVAIPVSMYLTIGDKPELIFIPILISGIGDGLAEPIGIRFGKHKYQTYALFVKRRYVRSIEGSACVFLTSIATVILFNSSFSPIQFVIALTTLPILMTLAEAYSPHTWDNPFIIAVGGILLFLILQFTV